MSKKETFWGEVGKKVPMDKVYDDVLHPALSEVGHALQGTVRVCLAPISVMVWSYYKIAAYLDEAIPRYFEERKILKDKIVSPDPAIAVPTIEALRYANKDIIKERYTTWIADYGVSEDRFEGQYDMLQYSETGRVPGISSNVDMNIMYRDLINEIKGSGTDPDPDPGTDKKTIEELAKEVIAGQWGDGEERKTRLTNAGYDYAAVQAKVNEILQSTDRKTVEELAKEVIAGQWGNGEERKTRLTNAGYDYAAVQAKVNEMLEENTSTTNYYKAVSSTYNSIVEALNSIGVDSSFNNRKQIAIKNGINDYTGTAEQNIELLNKLKDGKLIEI